MHTRAPCRSPRALASESGQHSGYLEMPLQAQPELRTCHLWLATAKFNGHTGIRLWFNA